MFGYFEIRIWWFNVLLKQPVWWYWQKYFYSITEIMKMNEWKTRNNNTRKKKISFRIENLSKSRENPKKRNNRRRLYYWNKCKCLRCAQETRTGTNSIKFLMQPNQNLVYSMFNVRLSGLRFLHSANASTFSMF